MNLLLVLFLYCSPFAGQTSTPAEDASPMSVTSFKWTKARRAVEATNNNGSGPAAAMIPQNKIFARNARANDPSSRDPNQETMDGRSAAIEKNVQESRSTQSKYQDGFLYKIKVQNPTKKVVEYVFWEYQFTDPADTKLTSRHQFLCGVNIRGEKGTNLEGFSFSGPVEVVSAETLAHKSDKVFQEKVLINRIEFGDGTIWQRKGWRLADVKASYDRVLRETWTLGMCKAL
jgi:hypothetical protein